MRDVILRPATLRWKIGNFIVVPTVVMLIVAARPWDVLERDVAKLEYAAALAIAWVALYTWLRRIQFVVGDAGVEKRGLLTTQRLAWTEMRAYSYLPRRLQLRGGDADPAIVSAGIELLAGLNRALFHGTPHRRFESGWLALHGDRDTITLRAESFLHPEPALDRVFAALHARFADSGAFGALQLVGQTLTHDAKGSTEVAQIARIGMAKSMLAIEILDPPTSWRLPFDKVENIALLLERLATAGVSIELPVEAFLPPSTRLAIGPAAQAAVAR